MPLGLAVPEGVVAVRDVGVARAEERVRDAAQEVVAHGAQGREVGAATALDAARALDEVRAVHERGHEQADLLGALRAVGVERDDDVARRGLDAALDRLALAAALLRDDAGVGTAGAYGLDGAIGRTAVDEHDLVLTRDPREHERDVRGLVECRDHDAHARRERKVLDVRLGPPGRGAADRRLFHGVIRPPKLMVLPPWRHLMSLL